MLLSHTHKFIYLKTRKTAGTSVEIYFEPFCCDPAEYSGPSHHRDQSVSAWGIAASRGSADCTWFNHMSGDRVRELAGESVWNSYLKFCVVRNPFDKVVSWFWHCLNHESRVQLTNVDFSRVRDLFSAWTERRDFPFDRFIYCAGDVIVVDEILRYENLTHGLAVLCSQIEIPWEPERLGSYKGQTRLRPEHFSEYYTPEAIARVADGFGWELRNFGYNSVG